MRREPVTVWVALGANLGLARLAEECRLLEEAAREDRLAGEADRVGVIAGERERAVGILLARI